MLNSHIMAENRRDNILHQVTKHPSLGNGLGGPRLTDFLPTTKKELELRGWDYVDVILFSGDAYVDHPAFGAAVIGRTLEAAGFRVAIVPQPDWHGDYRDF